MKITRILLPGLLGLGLLGLWLGWGTSSESDELEVASEAMASAAMKAGEYGEAYRLYERVASEENPLAYFNLGLIARDGLGREPDPVAACQHFGKAAQGSVPYAQHLYAECLVNGTHQAADPALAAVHYRQAVEGGHAISNCHLGQLHMQGLGVEKDPAQALALCESAAGNSPPAMLWMARFYLEGDESVRDYAQALYWLSQARQYAQPGADYYLGIMSEMGLIKEYPPEQALGLFESAAEKRYADAYLPSGRLRLQAAPDPETGYPTADNLAKAYMWLKAASLEGEAERRAAAERELAEVLKVMPESWKADLDARVEAYLNGENGQGSAAQP